MSAADRYVKLKEIDFGIVKTYTGEEIIQASIIEEVDPIASLIVSNRLRFKLMSKDKDFNLANPKGIYSMFQSTQPVETIAIIDGVKQPMGTFYLESWQQETENTSSFMTTDAVGILDKTIFRNGEVYVNKTADYILQSIMTSANWTPYEMDADLKTKVINGYLPICTHKEALQQLAIAIGGVIDTTRSNLIKIKTIPKTVTKTIGEDRKNLNVSKSKLREFVSHVEVTAHSYTQAQAVEEIYKATLAPGTYEIEFDDPRHSLSVTNATITTNKTNYAVIQVASTAEVILSGKKYTHQTQTVTKAIPETPSGLTKKTSYIENVTLVDQTNAQAVAQKTLDYLQVRQEEIFGFGLKTEKTGEWVAVSTINGSYTAAVIEKLEIDLTGGYRVVATASGFNKEILEYIYTGELYAGQTLGVI